jgi:hypothetical protein
VVEFTFSSSVDALSREGVNNSDKLARARVPVESRMLEVYSLDRCLLWQR